MGCNSSKVGSNGNKDGWSNFPLVRSLSRSFSMPQQNQAKQQFSRDSNSQSFHIVALTSSTYGVLKLFDDPSTVTEATTVASSTRPKSSDRGDSSSKEPEVIDVWELMEDLNEKEYSTEQPSVKRRKRTKAYSKSSLPPMDRSRSVKSMRLSEQGHGLPVVLEKEQKSVGVSRFSKEQQQPKLQPQLQQFSRSKSTNSAAAKKGLFYGAWLRKEDAEEEVDDKKKNRRVSLSSAEVTSYDTFSSSPGSPVITSVDDDWCLLNHRHRREILSDAESVGAVGAGEVVNVGCPPGGEDRVVLYSTSLQGIRKTYEECKRVRMILEGMMVRIDERDVSMHKEFRKELRELVGLSVGVPRVFINGKYVGGVEEVMEMNENGVLRKLMERENIPKQLIRKACQGCGGVRFIPCIECSGSCKLVDEDGVVRRCCECNENGLLRCPICY